MGVVRLITSHIIHCTFQRIHPIPADCYRDCLRRFNMIVLLVSFAILATVSGEPFPNRIRSDIADCYQQFDRFQRFPQSMDNLVALIRKVEAHPDTQFWDLKRMTGVLLHRFRYDGIIDDLKAGPNLPIHTDHSESDKFKLQWQFLPGESTDFPESSLTQAEKCSIHWMLSHSINMTMRAEELVSRKTHRPQCPWRCDAGRPSSLCRPFQRHHQDADFAQPPCSNHHNEETCCRPSHHSCCNPRPPRVLSRYRRAQIANGSEGISSRSSCSRRRNRRRRRGRRRRSKSREKSRKKSSRRN